MKLKPTKKFGKQFQKIKDRGTKEEISKKIKRLINEHSSKKHLRNVLSGNQTVRTRSKRIIYEVKGNKIILKCIRPRKEAYK